MRRAHYSASLLLLLSMGCVHEKPQTQPEPVAATPDAPKAAPKPAPPVTAKAAPKGTTTKPAATAKAPAATAKAPATPKPPPSKALAPQAAPAPAGATTGATAGATLDLEALKAQLKQTKAIGVFTKLSLKNQVDDLLDKFRAHHAGKPPSISELRRSYDLLMMKVLSLLQDEDQKLASDIVSSRERIWGLLADPKKFAALPV